MFGVLMVVLYCCLLYLIVVVVCVLACWVYGVWIAVCVSCFINSVDLFGSLALGVIVF